MTTPGGIDNTVESLPAPIAADPAGYARIEVILRENPCPFEFFQAVRLIERLLPHRAPVGRFVSPDKEVMRFNAHCSFSFPASSIQRIVWDGDIPVLVVN